MTTITAVNSPSINYSEFVRISVGDLSAPTVYSYTNGGAPITVNGITFTNMGTLLTVGAVQRDIKASSVDMSISLTGLVPSVVSLILSSSIKGSLVEVWRGFLDTDNQIITSPTQQFFKRYSGIVNNVSISETFDEQARSRIATCTVSCSSMRAILNNRISGIKTNQQSWQAFYSNDVSMNRVAQISNEYFDFGALPNRVTTSSNENNFDSGGSG
jgi:hypothetical protein